MVGLSSSIDDGLISAAEYKFFDYMARFGKTYGTKEEYNFRLGVFAERLSQIDEHNSQEGRTSTMGVNKFSDWTQEEIKKMNGLKAPAFDYSKATKIDDSMLPDAVDWRKQGAVTPVKDQGHCGSCWSFSTTGSMEGAHFIKTGNLVSLSEKNLVDCSHLNFGCGGGNIDTAFLYAMVHPLELESDYPYRPESGLFECKYKKAMGKVKVSSISLVAPACSEQLKAHIAKGPVSVGIEADQPVFHQYTGGIITSSSCGSAVDHAVLAIGYGKENGQEYYIVKNSWGADWGENGYVRIGVANGLGICGIQSQPSQPHTD
jgi:cathepsin L